MPDSASHVFNLIMLLTDLQLSYKMSYMRKATNISIRELQQNLKGVIARVERGQIVEVTRHGGLLRGSRRCDRLVPFALGLISTRALGQYLVTASSCRVLGNRHRGPRRAVTTYVDSSVLVAIYVPERFSNAARQTVRAVPQVPFTQLHELEVPNAFELLVGRGLISREECRAIQAQLQEDLESQRLARVSLDLDRVFTSASDLSRTYTAKVSHAEPGFAARGGRASDDVFERSCRPTIVSSQSRKPPASRSWISSVALGARSRDSGRCPFLALSVQQGAANGSKRRHKAKVENRPILRAMARDPATSSTPPQRAANASFSAC